MTDEKFTFIDDVRDKKRTARGAHNRVSPRGGKMKLPSDFLSEKEIKAMSGEVKSYDLKQPMKWAQYKELPEDLKKEYLERLQTLYKATDASIAAMMGVSRPAINRERMRLNIPSLGKGARCSPEWMSFVQYGTPTREATAVKDLVPPEIKAKLADYEEKHPPAVIVKTDSKTPLDYPIGASYDNEDQEEAVPDVGDIRIKGRAATVGKTLALLLGDKKMAFRISWEVIT